MFAWTRGCLNARMHECKKTSIQECMDACIKECMNSRMHGCMNAWMKGPQNDLATCSRPTVRGSTPMFMFADLGLAECTFGVLEKPAREAIKPAARRRCSHHEPGKDTLKARLAPWKAHKKQLASPFQPLGAMPFRDPICRRSK